MIRLAVNQRVGKKINERTWRGWLKVIGREVKLPSADLSLALVDKPEIKRLNRIYRRKNRVTDVLSFAEIDALAFIPHRRQSKSQAKFLGEIILCYPLIVQQAKTRRVTIENELKRLFVHAVLHLLGYDHKKSRDAKAMEARESK